MKKTTLIIAILLFVGIGAHSQGVFDVQVKNIDGTSITLSEEIKGELIVLDFWTTWCKPCIRSIPSIIALSEKYDETKVQFVAVNEDSPRNMNKVKPVVRSLNIPYLVVLDTEQNALSELLVNAFPTLIILDKKGNVLYTHVGFTSGDEVELEAKINELLAEL